MVIQIRNGHGFHQLQRIGLFATTLQAFVAAEASSSQSSMLTESACALCLELTLVGVGVASGPGGVVVGDCVMTVCCGGR
jgi:hypothetical protein